MSKMSELSMVLEELRICGETMIRVAEELTEMFSSEKPKKAAKKAAEKVEAVAEEPAAEPVKEYSFTEVRTILAEKSKAGHTAKIKEILKAHGAEKLSEIAPEEYAGIIAEVEVLG